MCLKCHRHLHELEGHFKGWEKGQLRTWQEEQVSQHRLAYERGEDTAPF